MLPDQSSDLIRCEVLKCRDDETLFFELFFELPPLREVLVESDNGNCTSAAKKYIQILLPPPLLSLCKGAWKLNVLYPPYSDGMLLEDIQKIKIKLW